MAYEQHAINVSSIPALCELVQEVSRTRRSKALRVDSGEAVFVTPADSQRRRSARTRVQAHDGSFLASYQAVPPLRRRLSVEQMTEIAAEEHAQEAARNGL